MPLRPDPDDAVADGCRAEEPGRSGRVPQERDLAEDLFPGECVRRNLAEVVVGETRSAQGRAAGGDSASIRRRYVP
jgi:hypothetical protein